ncbi:hypothetical protein [Jeotgalibacillus terrae]|uniref:Uncharacterized protein n=1 Tax=Jeotgalibacillus terrae TaxID=587735 RepID=A0ABW5ZQG3_9BACL|nr:hypothetical protein [Jeotgalibacillus terrae]MBM7581083.1 hypothetical protein [Jeotgalibacillus terrae]
MESKLPVLKQLTDNEYRVLKKAHAKHNGSLGAAEREKYSLNNIVKVEFNKADNCLNVHYDDGNWWHYCPNGSWY